MQFLTSDESRRWTEQHGYQLNAAFGHPIAGELDSPLRFRIPEDAGARVLLARTLWETAGDGVAEVLLWITDRGMWPSGEHLPLAEAVRRGLGAQDTLDTTPGHLVRLGESDAGLSILCLAILFLWDCWVLPAGGRPALFLSHDEFGVADVRAGDFGLGRRLSALDVLTNDVQAI